MLRIQNMTVQYGQKPPAVTRFNLDMKPGEIISIVGESGSGKTTVVRSILGLLPARGQITEGQLFFENEPLLDQPAQSMQKLRGSRISMIFQDNGSMLNPIKKIGTQFVNYIRTHKNMTKSQAQALAMRMFTQMRLPDAKSMMNSYPFQLSGGMRQRVGIAMAMVFEPRLLLADEPTSALDVTTQAQIVGQMMALRKDFGTAIMIVTHNLGVAAYMADRIVVMRAGKIVESGTSKDVITNPQNAYTKELVAAVPTLGGTCFVKSS